MADSPYLYRYLDGVIEVEIRASAHPGPWGGRSGAGIQIILEDQDGRYITVRLPREQARELAEAIVRDVDDNPGHIIEFRTDGWTIQHPLSCRPSLFDCPVNRVAEVDLTDPPDVLGRFECEVNDLGDRLLIGDRVEGGTGG